MIYIASKTVHGPRWRKLRDAGHVPINSTWIDESAVGATSDFTDLWRRCIHEASAADALVVYREEEEQLKGALIEVGAALASHKPVFAVGFGPYWSFLRHSLVTSCPTIDEAIALAQECQR